MDPRVKSLESSCCQMVVSTAKTVVAMASDETSSTTVRKRPWCLGMCVLGERMKMALLFNVNFQQAAALHFNVEWNGGLRKCCLGCADNLVAAISARLHHVQNRRR